MPVAVQQPAHDVPTTLNYYTPIGEEAPFQYVQSQPEGVAQHNLGSEPHSAVIRDARDRVDDYNLGIDKSGFSFVKHESAEAEFIDEERIKDVYYKEVEELLKKEVGAKRVFIFDHTIRSATSWEVKVATLKLIISGAITMMLRCKASVMSEDQL